VLFAMANCGLPGTSGFVGEWMVILSAVRANFWVAFAAAFTLFLGAAYSLWLVKRVLYGSVGNDHVREMKDISQREFVILGLCAIPVVLLGIWPSPLLDVMHATVTNLVHQVVQTKLTGG
jgi:NADH-quinone oxidoreductase subunit M